MWTRSLTDDARSSIRRIVRHPRNPLLLAFMLAVSIGSITAVFDIGYNTLNGSLPYANASRIAITNDALASVLVDPYDFRPNPRLSAVFERAARYESYSANLNSDSGLPPQRIQLAMVTPLFFSTLGVRIRLGQDFSPDTQLPPDYESMPSSLPIILSDRLWKRDFGSDRKIVGRSLTLNMRPYHFEIIGVAPPGVDFPSGTEAWIPIHLVNFGLVQTGDAVTNDFGVVGLLLPGLSPSTAKEEIQSWPQNTGVWANWGDIGAERLTSFREFLAGKLYRLSSTLWLATVFFLALTVAGALSILQIEMEMRAPELRIRRMLGAMPIWLLRSFSMETAFAIIAGLVFSLLIRTAVLRMTTRALRLRNRPVLAPHWIDVTLAVAAVGILFIAAVADEAHRLRLFSFSQANDLKPRPISRFRFPLQVIPATLILITATMLTGSAYRLIHTDPGVKTPNAFISEAALRLDIDQPFNAINMKLPIEERNKKLVHNVESFNQRVTAEFLAVLQRLKNENGVTDVGAISISPYNGGDSGGTYAFYGPTPAEPPASRFIDYTAMRSITSSAISSLGMRLILGRDFSGDAGADRATVLINEVLAAHLGGDEKALGQYLRLGSRKLPPDRIIGVVNNVHEKDLYSPEVPTVYYAFSYRPVTDIDLIVRTSGKIPTQDVARLIRADVAAIAPDATVSHFLPLTEMVQAGTQWTDYSAYFLLALAALGIFMSGICAWAKAASEMHRRRHEIGVRLALGSSPARILRLIVGNQVKLTLVAALLGALLAFWFVHLVSYLFYEVSPSDIGSYLIGIASMTVYVAIVGFCSIKRTLRSNPCELLASDSF